jgi:hypothetical protein
LLIKDDSGFLYNGKIWVNINYMEGNLKQIANLNLHSRNYNQKNKRGVIAIKSWVETKNYFSGAVERFECELVVWEDYFTILKHTVQTKSQVGKFNIAPGNVTYRFHWPNRSYNLVKYFSADGALLANCFQLIDSVELAEGAGG